MAGYTFAKAIRAFMRHDLDIILIGEIRDFETAKTAIEASLTGHLVFSTLHTNDAVGTIARLAEIGIDPYLLAGSFCLVCAQTKNRRYKSAVLSDFRDFLATGTTSYKSRGCDVC